MNTNQSNTYRKDLSWLHFDNEPMVQERQKVKCQVATRSTSPDRQQFSIHGCKVDLQRFVATSGEKKIIEQIKASIFLEEVLAREIM